MRSFKWLARALSMTTFAVAASVGCNGLLGNEEGTARVADAAVSTDAGEGGTVAEGGANVCDTSQGNKVCFGLCVKIDQTNTGCGGTSCAACDPKNVNAAVCKGSARTFDCNFDSCKTNFGDCDMNPANGCEKSLVTKASCGACDKICTAANGGPLCAVGSDGTPSCVDKCPTGTQQCGAGSCVDTSSSSENCGMCDFVCTRPNASAICMGGKCVFTCQPGTHACGTTCASDVDPAFCGAMCARCQAPAPHTVPTCSGGACGTACESGFLDCDGDTSNGCELAGKSCPPPSGCIPPCTGKTSCCVNTCIPNTITCSMLPPAPGSP